MKNEIKRGVLYIVGTPIGNLSDISQRALKTLESVDFIAAEDTRVTVKLLNHFDIKKPLISYFEHNKMQKGDYICDRIKSGESCALVSDAGMPAISDPGELLVAQCRERGIEVFVVPGPSAVVCALATSGLSVGRFTFEGFLSMNKRNRREHLEELVSEKRTMVFYEAPHKLQSTLKDMLSYFGNRRVCIAKEITKLHENVLVTDLENAISHYENNPPKGEFVLVVEGEKKQENKEISLSDAVEMARGKMEKGFSANEAAKQVAALTKLKKGDIYKLVAEKNSNQ